MMLSLQSEYMKVKMKLQTEDLFDLCESVQVCRCAGRLGVTSFRDSKFTRTREKQLCSLPLNLFGSSGPGAIFSAAVRETNNLNSQPPAAARKSLFHFEYKDLKCCAEPEG